MILGVATGRLITVEGLDGAGKTTLVAGLTRELAARGRELMVLREPGGVELSERIRALVKDPELDVDARAEALLYAAARAQLVAEQLVPLLESGQWVLLDAVGRARITDRDPDRLEQASAAFFAAVAEAYDELAAAEPDRIAVIEADRPPEQVLADALAAIDALGDG